jgi:phytoene/squalene synthetase
MNTTNTTLELASATTKAASQQTYYTIRYLVDRERVADAYRAYAYFRWVDDILDTESTSSGERSAFIARQKSILEKSYRGEVAEDVDIHETMLVELIQQDAEKNSGLQIYLRNMMAVMNFDAGRRGGLVSQREFDAYTLWLSSAVTEAMHYFIGRECYSPHTDARYMAVTAAHITHMLRDTFDDVQAGYFNIPREVLEANHLRPQAICHPAYRTWVQSRVQLARDYFKAGRDYLRKVENPRCRLAGFAYTARFEWLLDTFEREDYCLRAQYNERKSFGTGLRMSLDTLFMSLQGLRGGSVELPKQSPA